MKKIITAVFLMLAFHVNAQDSSKFTVELLNNMLNQYQDCKIVSPDYAIVGNGEKKGVVDYNGNIVLPIKYIEIKDFSDGMAVVKDENYKYGYVDNNFNLVIPCKYTLVSNFYNGLAIVSDGKYSMYVAEIRENSDNIKFINKTGQVVEISSRIIERFPDEKGNGLFENIIDNGWKYLIIDSQGRVKFIDGYEYVYPMDNYFIVKKNGKQGLLNGDGKQILPCIYNVIVKRGLIVTSTNNEWQVYDENLNKTLTYNTGDIQDLTPINNNWLILNTFDKRYVIDKTGNALIVHEGISQSNKYFIFYKDGRYYVCNENGIVLFSRDKEILDAYDDFVRIEENKKYGLQNYYGAIVLPCEYDEINYEYGFFHVKKNGKSSYVECVNIHKLANEAADYIEQASKAWEKENYSEVLLNYKKADEIMSIIENNPHLSNANFINLIKTERGKMKQNVETASGLLNGK